MRGLTFWVLERCKLISLYPSEPPLSSSQGQQRDHRLLKLVCRRILLQQYDHQKKLWHLF
jgi:hypothetical protein